MRSLPSLVVTPCLLSTFAFSASDDVAETTPASVEASTRDWVRTVEVEGVLIPRTGEELAIWPEAWSGELLVLEVVEHGAWVNRGDVLVRFETRAFDRELERAARDLKTAELSHEDALLKASIAEESAADRVEDARYALDRARLELESWKETELEFRRRGEELSAQYTQHNIDDQQDELDQLEAMYAADELVDATEEIVLRRSRRNLARSKVSQKLNEDRLAHQRALEIPHQTRQKEKAVERAESALDRLERQLASEARLREDSLARSKVELDSKRERHDELLRDRAAIELRAPKNGVLLHGGLADQGPGRTRPVHAIGGRAALRKVLFTVCESDRLDLALRVPASKRKDLEAGAGARLKPKAAPGKELVGVLEMQRYPTAQPAGSEDQYEARVVVEGSAAGLVAGMHATVELELETLPNAVFVPAVAIFGQGDDRHVWVVGADGHAQSRTVKLGSAEDGEVVVEVGLAAGERLLLKEPTP